MDYNLEGTPQVNLNIMEMLVQEEMEKQLKFYPQNVKKYLNKIEIATFALNRLPALYASSKTGKEQQLQLGKKKYKKEIVAAVRRGIAAVERDPLRKSTPLVSQSDTEYQLANTTLEKLEKLLFDYHLLTKNQRLSWNNLASVLQQGLSEMSWRNNQAEQSEFISNSQFTYDDSFGYSSASLDDGFNCSFYR